MTPCGPTLFRVILKGKNKKRLIARIAMQIAQKKFDADFFFKCANRKNMFLDLVFFTFTSTQQRKTTIPVPGIYICSTYINTCRAKPYYA